jgi:hypothetical protein
MTTRVIHDAVLKRDSEPTLRRTVPNSGTRVARHDPQGTDYLTATQVAR